MIRSTLEICGIRLENMGKKWGKDGGVMGDALGDMESILGLLFSRRGVEQKIFEVKRSLMGKEKDPAKYQ